jgi:ankyrin repeat protein
MQETGVIMPKIFYYPGAQAHLADYTLILEALGKGETTPGTKVEKLRGHALYSLRINIRGRILFTYFPYKKENYLLVLEILPDHEYYRSKFLKPGSAILKRFLSQNAEEIIEEIRGGDFEDAEPAVLAVEESSVDFNYVPVHLGHDTLVFDDVQTEALAQKAPLVIQGPPGSGKTSLALAFLLDGIMKKEFERILYVTQSNNLRNQMQKDWESHPEHAEHQDKIEILAYKDLFKAQNEDFSWDVTQSQNVFGEWLGTYKKQHKKAFAGNLGKIIFQEFRIISGHSQEKYLSHEVGNKQSLVKDQEDRRAFFEAYTNWLQYLKEKNITLCDFAKIPVREAYDRVMVDETQDFSHLQVAELLSLAKKGEIIYCIDQRQSLTDNNPKLIYIKNLVLSELKSLSEMTLPTNYRCPRQVIHFAEVFNEVRRELTPVNKAETGVMATNVEGHVSWIAPGNAEKEGFLSSLQDNVNVCVITHAEFVEEVKGKFGFIQVLTPDQAKGLQFKTIILYRILDTAVFAQANSILEKNKGERDVQFSAPFSACFVAATRAQETVFVYQEERHAIRHIVTRLKNTLELEHGTAGIAVSGEKSSKEEWEAQAVKYFTEGFTDTARNILEKYLGMDEQGMQEWEVRKNLVFFPPVTKNSNSEERKTGSSHKGKKKAAESSSSSQGDKTPGASNLPIEASSPKEKTAINSKKKDKQKVKQPARDKQQITKEFREAVEKKEWEKVIKLVNEGADVNIKLRNGLTPLHLAAYERHAKVVELLVDAGANIQEKMDTGATALHLAAQDGHDKMVELLLGKDAKIDEKMNDDVTALHLAAQDGHDKVVELLLSKGAKIDEKRNDGATALHLAAQNGHDEVVKLLLGKGVNIQEKKDAGHTALHVAAQEGYANVVGLLLEGKAKVDEKTDDGYTALHLAAQAGHDEVVKLLLGKGAKIDEKMNEGYAALHVAAENGHEEMVELLLNKGAKIDEKTNNGTTALHLAAYQRHAKVVELLVDAGAKIDEKMNEGYAALHLAAQNGHEEMVELLLSKGAKVADAVDMLLKLIFKSENLSLLESLLKHEELKDFDWNGVIVQQMTVLMLVCKSKNQAKPVELAKILINEKSVEIAKRNDMDITAVFQAMLFKNSEMIKLFLDKYQEIFSSLLMKDAKKNISVLTRTIDSISESDPYRKRLEVIRQGQGYQSEITKNLLFSPSAITLSKNGSAPENITENTAESSIERKFN